MRRRLARLADSADRSSQELKDDALAFFESCLHLKDWIKSDDTMPKRARRAAERYVWRDPNLSRCRHVAIASKHARVRDYPRPDDPGLRPTRTTETRPAHAVYGDDDDENWLPPHMLIDVVVPGIALETDDGEVEDAVAFAVRCVQSWDRFIEKHGPRR